MLSGIYNSALFIFRKSFSDMFQAAIQLPLSQDAAHLGLQIPTSGAE